MGIVKKIVIALIVLVVILAAVGSMLPGSYKVERSIVINAPAEIVFDQVNDLKKNEAWSPWKASDSSIRISYGAITAGKGATSSWTSKKSGNGSMTIEESDPGRSLKIDLVFEGQGGGKALWSFTPEGEGVKVDEAMAGDLGRNPFKHLFGLVIDKMIGPYFERGLASLKAVSEQRAAEAKSEQASTRQAAAAPAETSVPTAADPAPKKP
jgi:hypothetical protein